MSESIWILIAAGVVVGIILLFVEYRTNWFARSLTSSSKKQSRIKSSPKQLPAKKPDLTKDPRNPYTSISSFLQKEWWLGLGMLATIALLILGIIEFILPGGFSNRIVSPPPSDIKGNSQQTVQQSEKPSTEYGEHPSPIEIYGEIQGQPLLQQKNTGDSFIGLKVQWHLKLFQILTSNSDPNVITIVLVEESRLYPDVRCDIDIREHPEIKRAKKDIGVFIMGEISKAELFHIELINCFVKLDY